MNRISDTKFFNFVNKKYNYNSKLSKINFKDYYIPADLINDKLNNFKGYKYPLVTEIIEAVKSGKIIPCNFSESNNPKKIKKFCIIYYIQKSISTNNYIIAKCQKYIILKKINI